jgi:hypothetical protein
VDASAVDSTSHPANNAIRLAFASGVAPDHKPGQNAGSRECLGVRGAGNGPECGGSPQTASMRPSQGAPRGLVWPRRLSLVAPHHIGPFAGPRRLSLVAPHHIVLVAPRDIRLVAPNLPPVATRQHTLDELHACSAMILASPLPPIDRLVPCDSETFPTWRCTRGPTRVPERARAHAPSRRVAPRQPFTHTQGNKRSE